MIIQILDGGGDFQYINPEQVVRLESTNGGFTYLALSNGDEIRVHGNPSAVMEIINEKCRSVRCP